MHIGRLRRKIDKDFAHPLISPYAARDTDFVRLTRIGRNTVLRLALIYAGMFSASILLLFGFIYWRTGGYLARQADDLILPDVEDLTEVYAAGGPTGLGYAIADHLQEDCRAASCICWRIPPHIGSLAISDDGQRIVGRREARLTVPSPRIPAKRWRTARARLVAFSDDVRLLVGRDIYSERRLHPPSSRPWGGVSR